MKESGRERGREIPVSELNRKISEWEHMKRKVKDMGMMEG